MTTDHMLSEIVEDALAKARLAHGHLTDDPVQLLALAASRADRLIDERNDALNINARQAVQISDLEQKIKGRS